MKEFGIGDVCLDVHLERPGISLERLRKAAVSACEQLTKRQERKALEDVLRLVAPHFTGEKTLEQRAAQIAGAKPKTKAKKQLAASA
jgi:hypothetical protein